MDKVLSNRIWVTRYLMVIGIVILHIPPYQPLSDLGDSPIDIVKAFFSHGLFRATVPVLTVLSGFLMFQLGAYRNPRAMLSQKVSTLLVPLLVWNVPFAVIVYLAQRYGLTAHDFSAQLYPFVNATAGLAGPPINFPLNFLRDLFAVSMFAPLFGIFLRRIPYAGLLVVGAVYFFNLDGPLVIRNSMLISFYIGGLAAVRNWDLTRLDRYAWPLLLVLFAYSLAVALYDIERREVFRIVSPFLVWPAMSLVMRSPVGRIAHRYSGASFFTFLSHGPLLVGLWIAFQSLSGRVPYFVFWLAAPLLVVLLGIAGSRWLKRSAPRIASLLLGGR